KYNIQKVNIKREELLQKYVLTINSIKKILSVIPPNVPSLNCSLLETYVLSHFETSGKRWDRLTLNGWLSYWAINSIEDPYKCYKQLTYLDLNVSTDRSKWFYLTTTKREDKYKDTINRSVIRILLFGS